MKEFIKLRAKFSDDYHHSVYMEQYEQAKMYEAEMIRLDALITTLSNNSIKS
jgi:hypothetical protein